MNDATPALFAFLLVLSLPMMTVVAANPNGEISSGSEVPLQRNVAPQTEPTEVENTTNRLQLTGDVRSEYIEYTPNLGMALAMADAELRIDHAQYTIVDDEFATATKEERVAMIKRAYQRIQQRTDELEQREREAARAHAAGERSSREFLQTLIQNHHEAAMLSDSLSNLETKASSVSGYSLRQTRSNYRQLDYHRTSIRSSLERLTTSPAASAHRDVVVSTSQNGYRIAIMDGTQYLVETARFDNRDETATDQFDDGEAYDHMKELYPWANNRPYFQDNSPHHYWAEMSHEQGHLEFYFDSGTGEVYREMQALDAPSIPSTEGERWLNNGVEVSVNRTPTDGPIEVTVTDSQTGAPQDATITIDGVEVGETGSDGKIWVIPPIGTHELVAKTPSGSTTGTISR